MNELIETAVDIDPHCEAISPQNKLLILDKLSIV